MNAAGWAVRDSKYSIRVNCKRYSEAEGRSELQLVGETYIYRDAHDLQDLHLTRSLIMGDISHAELPSKMVKHNLPRIIKTHNAGQLVVDDKPYLVLGAELQNSSFSSPSHMAGVWQKMKDMNVNTVLGSVPWEMIEPEEGRFDFTVLDQLIQDARRHDLKLILLWFGTWKNGELNEELERRQQSCADFDDQEFRRMFRHGSKCVPHASRES